MRRVRFCDFDGRNRHTVLDGSVPHVFSLAVFEEWMFWTDWNHMAVEKANRFSGADRSVLVNVTHRPMTVRVVHPLLQRTCESRAEHVSGAENGADRGESRVSGSGAVSGHSRKRLSGSGSPRSGERVSQK